MSREETAAYLAHRSTVAGATTNPFDQGSQDAIYEIGRGNLRATDRLALKAPDLAAAKDASAVDHVQVIDARRLLWPWRPRLPFEPATSKQTRPTRAG